MGDRKEKQKSWVCVDGDTGMGGSSGASEERGG